MSEKSERFTEYVRLLGNPYAKEQLLYPADLASDLRPLTDQERAYVRQLENQYAPLSIGLREKNIAPVEQVSTRLGAVNTVSKDDFDQECRRIFRRYIPALEKGRLRRHHREFITRNQLRTPAQRFELLTRLRKYDLPAIETRFNREAEDLTERKLKQIEIAVFGPDK